MDYLLLARIPIPDAFFFSRVASFVSSLCRALSRIYISRDEIVFPATQDCETSMKVYEFTSSWKTKQQILQLLIKQ